MNAISLKDLKPNSYFTKNLFLDGGFVLLAPETPVTEELVARLTRWEFRELRSEGSPVESIIESASSSAAGAGGSEGTLSLSDGAGDRERIEAILGFLAAFTDYVESVYTKFVTTNELDFKAILDKTKELCELIAANRRFVLRTLSAAPGHKNYLVAHSVRSSILAAILGAALKLPPFRLIELAASAILHEIGMVRLPPQIYMAGRSLTPLEKKSITAHPVLGYNLLKERQVPLAVCLGALEHHERMNGTGYPRGLSGDKISLYSRIIMVACSYDAVTAKRPYKEAKDGYAGMLDILKNEGKQYDETVIRALVYSLSIFPIGTVVLLSNGKKGVVVDVNPDNPRLPIVQILGAKSPDGKDIVIATAEGGVKVVKVATAEG